MKLHIGRLVSRVTCTQKNLYELEAGRVVFEDSLAGAYVRLLASQPVIEEQYSDADHIGSLQFECERGHPTELAGSPNAIAENIGHFDGVVGVLGHAVYATEPIAVADPIGVVLNFLRVTD